MISPKWETFKVEASIKKVLEELLPAKIQPEDDEKGWNRRIDLVLGAGDVVLILEFMQPGKPLDIGHIGRFEYYVSTIRTHLAANTGGQFKRCTGYLVASGAVKDAAIASMVVSKAREDMHYLDWPKTVQGILRHEDVGTTMQLYVQSDQESKLEAQGRFLELLLGDKAHLLRETIQ